MGKEFNLQKSANIIKKILRIEESTPIEVDGITYWRLPNGDAHRLYGPAIEGIGGGRWYKNGVLHRVGGPAVDYHGGIKEWYKNGQLHRENGPAVEQANGHKEWWVNGKRI